MVAIGLQHTSPELQSHTKFIKKQSKFSYSVDFPDRFSAVDFSPVTKLVADTGLLPEAIH